MKPFADSLRVTVCGVLFALVSSRPSVARAQLAYDAAAECPSRDEFERRLSGHSVEADVVVKIRATDSGFVGDLARGENVVRRVEGQTCDAVVDALVLAITLGAVRAPIASSVEPPGEASISAQNEKPSEATPRAPKPSPSVSKEERAKGTTRTPNERQNGSRGEESEVSRRFSLELNPLAVFVGRYSLTGEVLVSRHHGIVVTPYVVHGTVDPDTNAYDYDIGDDAVLNGWGGEIGYRYYFDKGLNGPYAGISALVGRYVWSGTHYDSSSGEKAEATRSDLATMSIGGALDVGYETVIGPGFVVGGGLGLQYTVATEERAIPFDRFASPALASCLEGFCPRFLLTVGYAF